MSLQTADEDSIEETPLLQPEAHQQTQRRQGRTPLPWRQFSIILFLDVSESLTSNVMAPFLPQLIRDIGITHGDETQVGFYVGVLQSLFYAVQALTVLHWSRVSDHIGRKPVLLTGLFVLSASMYCFGLSTSFGGLVLSRCLSAALDGNIGVVKSVVAEITDSTNLPQAYAFIPLAWSTGSTLGPFVGGSLSKPVDRFPDVFGNWEFFKTYPYFLACAVPATCSALCFLVACLFLNESLPYRVPLRRLIRSKFMTKSTVKSIPLVSNSTDETLGNDVDEVWDEDEAPVPFRNLLVPHVLIAAGNYATLSLSEIAFGTMQPVFFATPIELGGLGLDPPRIGHILSIYGMVNGLVQVLFFADLHDRFGTKVVYSTATLSCIPMILIFPLINMLARAQGLSWMVLSLIGAQLLLSTIFSMGYACIFIYIAAASPNRASLGTTTGIAQLLVAIMRTIGPASTMSMFSLSIKTPSHAWFVYAYLLFLVFINVASSLLLPRKVWTR